MTICHLFLWLAPAAAARSMKYEPISCLHLDEPPGTALDPFVASILLFPRPEIDSKRAILTALHTERFPNPMLGYDGECEGNTALKRSDDAVASVPLASSSTTSSDRELSDENGKTTFKQLNIGCASILPTMLMVANMLASMDPYSHVNLDSRDSMMALFRMTINTSLRILIREVLYVPLKLPLRLQPFRHLFRPYQQNLALTTK